METKTASDPSVEKSKQMRSPAYPSMALGDAIEKVATLYNNDGARLMSLPVMAEHWKSTIKSSAFNQWVSTLKQFGLLDESKTPAGRQFKLTGRALDIVMLSDDPENPTRLRAIKEVALIPGIHAELWSEYGAKLPSDINLTHFLVTKKNFVQDTAKDLIRYYKKTIELAKLDDRDKMPTGSQPVDAGDPQKESVGKDVGMEQASNYQGMATSQVPVWSGTTKAPPAGIKQDIFTADTGEVVVRWPAILSEEDYADIDGWLEMLKRKIRRSVSPNLKSDGPAKTDMKPQ